MEWQLRSLPRCFKFHCNYPATDELYNDVNVASARYCALHAPEALRYAKREAAVYAQREAEKRGEP